jgi:hypothetical protein
MGVYSDGSYNVPAGLIYSFPVTTANGEWKIVQGNFQSLYGILMVFTSIYGAMIINNLQNTRACTLSRKKTYFAIFCT